MIKKLCLFLLLLGSAVAQSAGAVSVLLFSGLGACSTCISAVETQLQILGLVYAKVDSQQMNQLTSGQLASVKLLLIPGGNSITMGQNLTTSARANIRYAVQNLGLHYLGICAGAFFAGSGVYNNLNLTNGVAFNAYSDWFKGIEVEAVKITLASGKVDDVFWLDGPQMNGWGKIVGKYPTGAPAIVEGKAGTGWMVLVGTHFEATPGWYSFHNVTSSTPVSVDNAYVRTLILAALKGTSLAWF